MADDRMKNDDPKRNMGTGGRDDQDINQGGQQTPGRNPQGGQQGGQRKDPLNVDDEEEFGKGGQRGGQGTGQGRGGQDR